MRSSEPKGKASASAHDVAVEVRIRCEAELGRLGYRPMVAGLLDRIERFAETLALWGTRMNLTARPDDPDEVAFHVTDSLMPLVLAAKPEARVLQGAFDPGRRVLDLGAGAGFPGLILASAGEADFTLAEARRKRASFLKVASSEMGLANVAIDERRLSPSELRADFDTVTARAFGAPVEVYRLAAAALRSGGIAILYANPSQRLDLAAARRLGLADYERIQYQVSRRGRRVDRILAVWRKL